MTILLINFNPNHYSNPKINIKHFHYRIMTLPRLNSRSLKMFKQPYELCVIGTDSGLHLRLNLEQYEYMRGPHSAGGLKILLHRQNEFPSVQDLGDAIPAGAYAFVGVQVYQVNHGMGYRKCSMKHTNIRNTVHNSC